MFVLCHDLGKVVDMIVDVGCYLCRPFLLVDHKVVIEVVKLWHLFVDGHEVVVAHLVLQLLMILSVPLLASLQMGVEVLQSPFAHHAGKGVFEDKCAQPVVDKLHIAAVRHLFVEIAPAQKRDLVSIEPCHVLVGQLAADGFLDAIDKHLDKLVHPFFGCLAQRCVAYRDCYHCIFLHLSAFFLSDCKVTLFP